MKLRPVEKSDQPWLEGQWIENWGAGFLVSKGKKIHVKNQHGYIMTEISVPVGFITYQVSDHEMEITSLLAKREQAGIGKMLIDQVKELAKISKFHRIWLVITNDNTRALAFYQKNGFSICGIRENIMDEYRKLKPEIPATGLNNIPIRDEIELEYRI